MKLRYLVVLLLLAAPVCARASRFSDALDLEAKGKLKEANELLHTAIDESRASGDFIGLARALSAAARISVSLGDYRAAIRSAAEAVSVRIKLNEQVALSEDYNTLGLANLYLGNYDAALSNYQQALEIDRRRHDAEAEIARLNNIGNVFYFRGQYQDSLRAYQQAMERLSGSESQPWALKRRQLTIANLATVYQRLGKEQTALEMYRQLTQTPLALPRTEYAQLLLNEGVLYRRMGDPVKALEQYRSAQAVFATEHHRDGEIGALRNIGIARAIDLNDLAGADDAFTAALDLAQQSSDARGMVQATLYRAEVLRRLGRFREAEEDLRRALAGSQKTGLPEEQWKAFYGLGRLAEAGGRPSDAAAFYRQAIAGIESMRGGIRRAALRSEFLADKRDVYDSLIELSFRQPEPPLDAIFSMMERSRARSLEERTSQAQPKELNIREARDSLPPDTVLIEFWVGDADTAALWITHSGSGFVRHAGGLRDSLAAFDCSLQNGDEGWKALSRDLGTQVLAGIPAEKHMIVAPDGPFAVLPLEALTAPASGRLVLEDCDISYVPAARFLAGKSARGRRYPLPPWRTQLLAFGDPPVSGADALGGGEQWQPIASSTDEVRSIARLLPGKSEVYLGRAAGKHNLLARHLEGTSLLHFSTHAVVDIDNPDRSRILMASESSPGSLDYLFQQEVYGLNLKGVDLVTVSACETARGKTIRGDGTQAFSQAFLAAGAAATVTSLWRVADRPTAEFMKQFYYFLSRGQTKSEALRSAKLQFLKSGSRWSAPRYWSAFVLNGDGWNPCIRVIPWSWLFAALGSAVLLAAISIRRRAPKDASAPR